MRSDIGHLVLLSGLLLLNVSPAVAQLQVGMPAPAVRAELLDGGTFDSAKQHGKVIVVNFWATWCKPCREEMPALDAFYRTHRAEGLELIAINIEGPEDLAKVKGVMKNFSFPAALAANGETVPGEWFGRWKNQELVANRVRARGAEAQLEIRIARTRPDAVLEVEAGAVR